MPPFTHYAHGGCFTLTNSDAINIYAQVAVWTGFTSRCGIAGSWVTLHLTFETSIPMARFYVPTSRAGGLQCLYLTNTFPAGPSGYSRLVHVGCYLSGV